VTTVVVASQVLFPPFLDNCLRHFKYESAIGINGAVWIRCEGGPIDLVVIRNALLNAEFLDDIQAEAMVEQLAALGTKSKKRLL
jgi:exosome complex RNA-binding protein Rrp4